MTEEVMRIRKPREGEVAGLVEERLGGDKLKVSCDDGNVRVCRITGKIRKRVWIRVGDVVLVEPWSAQSDIRADVIWRYTRTEAMALKRQGFLKSVDI
jgi:translation initiation factor 1A